jgi:carbon monoxide dehydrogenase subunit G
MPHVVLSGAYRVDDAPERVYSALRDPAVLKDCIKGCEQLVEVEPGVYDAALRLGLGAIRGRYTGRARVADEQYPDSFKLIVDGKGSAGFVRGEAHLTFLPSGDGTEVTCAASADAGGALAAVGSRLIQAAAVRMMDRFFTTFVEELRSRRS